MYPTEEQIPWAGTASASPSDTERLMSGPMGVRQRNIIDGSAVFLGLRPSEVFKVIRTVWTTAKGQPDLTDREIGLGLAMVARYELDPFAREIYVTRDKKGRLMIIIGLDGWIRILDRTDHYDGFEQELIFDPKDDTRVTRVITKIHSTKRTYPTTYQAFACEYAKLGGFMAKEIPSHMLRIFSLRHAARLFVPLGCVVTQEEAAWMGAADAAPAVSSLTELTEKLKGEPAAPEEIANYGGVVRSRNVSETTSEVFSAPPTPEPAFNPPTEEAADATLDPPTTEEIGRDLLADQNSTADVFAHRIRKAVSLANIGKIETDIITGVGTGKLTQEQARGLAELVLGARERIA